MLHLKATELLPGMQLTRDLHYMDPVSLHAITLSRGTMLTHLSIQRMIDAQVSDVYVDIDPSQTTVNSMISRETKQAAVYNIAELAKVFCKNGSENEARRYMDALIQVSDDIVENFRKQRNLLVNILDLKIYDDYTFHHSLSVALMALGIGIDLGLPVKDLDELVLAGMLHDIGKTAVPLEILRKPSRLTPQEFAIMKVHPLNAGSYLIKKNMISSSIFRGVVSHHEKWDGSGYPNGLQGSHIPLFGRILMIADIYDALTSQRPYRNPSPPSEAIEYIMGGSGTYFDVELVQCFLRRVIPYPLGSHVVLSNGEKASVFKYNGSHPLRPQVVSWKDQKIIDLLDPACYNITIVNSIETEPQDQESNFQ